MTKSIYSSQMIALRAWLRSERQNQNLSMRALASKLDRPHSFVQRVEEGDRRLDVVEYFWYCQALGVDPVFGLGIISSLDDG
ncbi:helix-turn-helix domain-containing protein [Moraxella marmotae]|uniref:helix-turn-helix domain-containing protein n=1 Tax=Moraxella marmotae TaxID=3344520 RepID=UPI0035F371E6